MKIKKLKYQSNHRGCKETDIMLGSFAEKYLNTFSNSELEDYSELLEISDNTLYDWVTGKASPSAEQNNKVLRLLIDFCNKDLSKKYR